MRPIDVLGTMAIVALSTSAVIGDAVIVEDFETFSLGIGHGQQAWASDDTDAFFIVETDVPSFGTRSAQYVAPAVVLPSQDLIRSPFITPGHGTVYVDVLIEGDVQGSGGYTLEVWGGSPTLRMRFDQSGAISVYQSVGACLYSFFPTGATWQPGVTTRIGIAVHDDPFGDMKIFQDGVLIDDVSSLGCLSNSIASLRVRAWGVNDASNTTITIDNLAYFPERQGDLDGDGDVDTIDMLDLLSQWGNWGC